MNTRSAILFTGLVAACLLASISFAPALATIVSSFLDVNSAIVATKPAPNGMTAAFWTAAPIPKDGSGGAFGYGVITEDGNALIVTTTHAGVLDSEKQTSASDPIFHNHFVQLKPGVEDCAPNTNLGDARLEVDKLTFESPGGVLILLKLALINKVPEAFLGTDALGSGTMAIVRGSSVADAVSFTLNPIFDDSTLTHVCVENVYPADKLIVVDSSDG